MNRSFVLYIFGVIAISLSIVFPLLAWLSPLTILLIIPMAAIWIWINEGRSLGDLGFRFSGDWLLYLAKGLVFGLGIPVLFHAIQVLGGWITLSPRGEPIQDLISYLPAVITRMIFLVGIEEFVFRGFFLNALSRRTGVWVAATLSSLLWSISHTTSMENDGLTPGLIIIGMASFLAWGIALSLGYLKAKKSLWLPYGLHLGVNLSFSLAGWFFITQPNAPQWWIGHPAWSPESGLIGVIVWIILALFLYWLTGSDQINRCMVS